MAGAKVVDGFTPIKGGLIVSCQVPDDTAINSPDFIAAMAQTVVQAGAVGVRAQGLKNVAAVANVTNVPIIGLVKRYMDSTPIHITPVESDVPELEVAGATIVAVDGTGRLRPNGQTLQEFFTNVRKRTNALLMADVDTLEAGIIAADMGFDAVATTLSGYTEKPAPALPNIALVEELAKKVNIPVIAEGGFSQPSHLVQAFDAGAWSVCIGTAITNPYLLTQGFVSVLK